MPSSSAEVPGGHYTLLPKFSLAEVHSSWGAWAILALSCLVTVAAWHVSSSWVSQNAETRFEFRTNDISEAIQQRMLEQEVVLRGGVGLFNASHRVSREEWADYTRALLLDKNLPGLQGFGYSELVEPGRLGALIDDVRAEGFPDFTVRPEGKRDLYSAILFLEPFRDRNLRAFGYDMWSEPTRRTAMTRARETGEASVSGVVTLVQETGKDVQRGFLMYLPVYKSGMPLESPEDRRRAIKGFVYSPFRMGDLMSGLLGSGDPDIRFRVFDGDIGDESRLLYDSAGNDGNDAKAGKFSSTDTIVVGGRTWRIAYDSQAEFLTASEESQPLIIAAGALVIDILLFLTIMSLAGQRRKALKLAESMTAELREARDAAESSAENERQSHRRVREANERLQRANEGLLQFTSIVAHDLRAPLKRVNAYVDILEEDCADSLDEDGRDVLTRIDRDSTRMRKMLDSLHNYAKYSDVSIAGKTTRIRPVIDNAIETLGPMATTARLEIDIDDDLAVYGDAMLLCHVFQNLISNAVKFCETGQPEIRIETGNRDGGHVSIVFSDNGIGIEREHTDKIFGMFQRLHNDDEYEGLGVGLAVCRKIIDDHCGTIIVDEDYDQGARFIITLCEAPLSDENSPRHVAA